ncbi:GntR family transcriptional regulator [Granulicatella seriolae]|uniref:GntR family transcriptional regulator n=1 Tax=Granulicatella seriolae TaxID=2967226 RepID=A0ABT1WP85_9LACT|nr:GntR family transcriptional regulator [Granulicatella seriolae]
MNSKPKYIKIYEDIRDKIMSGEYKINQKLADGNTLAKQFQVSAMTVKRALDELVSEGFIVRRQGDGSYVKNWNKGQSSNFYSINGTYIRFPNQVTSKVLKFDIEYPTKEVAEKLSIQESDFIYVINRLRLINDIPSIIEYTYMPITVISNLRIQDVESSIYRYIKEVLQLNVQSSFLNIIGCRPTELEKKHLQLSDTDFLMQVEQIANLDDGRIFEYSIARHIPEEFEFKTLLFNN